MKESECCSAPVKCYEIRKLRMNPAKLIVKEESVTKRKKIVKRVTTDVESSWRHQDNAQNLFCI